jgi:hypothetical protein
VVVVGGRRCSSLLLSGGGPGWSFGGVAGSLCSGGRGRSSALVAVIGWQWSWVVVACGR